MRRTFADAARARRILVADDEASTREGLAAFLREEGYRVDVAADGEEALAACRARPPDLLITDLGMPQRRGESLLLALRETHPEIEVAVITGESRLDTGRRAAGLGVKCYLNKPLDLDDVARRVRELLEPPLHAPAVAAGQGT